MVLKGLEALPVEVTAVVNVTDNGGHTGYLRKQLDIPAVGDLRQCISALAGEEELLGQLLDVRFSENDLEGTQLGNLILSALLERSGSLSNAAEELCNALLPEHLSVKPVSDESGQVGAVLENSERIVGEWQIIERETHSPIDRIFHEPEITAGEDVIGAIDRADHLLLSPGNLYTGVLSCVNTENVSGAIQRSDAPLTYICNLLTFPPLTDGYTAWDHMRPLEETINRPIDTVLINNDYSVFPDDIPDPISGKSSEPVPFENIPDRIRVITKSFVAGADELAGEQTHRSGSERYKTTPHTYRHDPSVLSTTFRELFSTRG